MEKFLNEMRNRTNIAYTENDARAYATTKSSLLDFFGSGGALRTRDEQEIAAIFDRAFSEDKLLALKIAFYLRDCRGGQGERRTFRTILKHLAHRKPDIVKKNIDNIPFYGRYDDLYALFGTSLEKTVGEYMHKQLLEDLESDNPSLLAKWLKSINTSSKESRRLAYKTRKMFGMSPKEYRKTLSKLRKKINVVEKKMTNNRWKDIDYERVPSKASLIYKRAFMRHDEEGYSEYLDSLEKGEAKINAKTLFPYEIVRDCQKWDINQQEIRVLDELWKALPDYIGDKTENSIAVVDVSGSMEGLPMDVALSVGMYLAEKNKGSFHNKFITFSSRPQLVEIKGTTIADRIYNMKRANWEMNTDIEAVFNMILSIAVKNHLHQDEIPGKIYIISDMEFDAATGSGGYWDNRPTVEATLFNTIEQRYSSYNYKMPDLVFWNVDSRHDQFPMSMDERGFQLVSGCSPSIFKATMAGEFLSAYDLMLSVINDERYDRVKV